MTSDTLRVWKWAREQKECPGCRVHKNAMALGLDTCPVCKADLRLARLMTGELGVIWLKLQKASGRV